jgi:hypothetical protein
VSAGPVTLSAWLKKLKTLLQKYLVSNSVNVKMNI